MIEIDRRQYYRNRLFVGGIVVTASLAGLTGLVWDFVWPAAIVLTIVAIIGASATLGDIADLRAMKLVQPDVRKEKHPN